MKHECDHCDQEMTWYETELAEEQGTWRYCKSNHTKCIACKYSGVDDQEWVNHGCPECTCEDE